MEMFYTVTVKNLYDLSSLVFSKKSLHIRHKILQEISTRVFNCTSQKHCVKKENIVTTSDANHAGYAAAFLSIQHYYIIIALY